MKENGISFNELSRRTGFSYSKLRRILKSDPAQILDIRDIEIIFTALGLDLVITDRATLVQLITTLNDRVL